LNCKISLSPLETIEMMIVTVFFACVSAYSTNLKLSGFTNPNLTHQSESTICCTTPSLLAN